MKKATNIISTTPPGLTSLSLNPTNRKEIDMTQDNQYFNRAKETALSAMFAVEAILREMPDKDNLESKKVQEIKYLLYEISEGKYPSLLSLQETIGDPQEINLTFPESDPESFNKILSELTETLPDDLNFLNLDSPDDEGEDMPGKILPDTFK